MSRGLILFRAAMAAALGVVGVAVAAPAGASNDPLFGKQWGFSVIGAPTAWSVGTGAGVTIAVVDSGVDLNHEDLRSKLLPGKDFVNSDNSAQDDYGHGTHVAGTAAAVTGNGVGGAGTAPGASILPVKVLGDLGTGSVADISAGIEWAADRGAQVINLSLGPDVVTGALSGNGLGEAVNYAWSRGSIVVIAAGNDYLFPSSARDTPAVVVTALTPQHQKAGYASTVGPAKWGLAAPGGAGGLIESDEDILSTLPNQAYGYMAGTSMAAPHVAGAAAVLRGMGLSPQATIDRLLATAKDVGAPGRDDVYGAGRLDLACAVGRCGAAATTTTGSAGAGSTPASPGTQPASDTSGSGGPSGGGGTSPGPAGPGAPSGSTGNDGQVPSEGGGSGSTATGASSSRSRTSATGGFGPRAPAGGAPALAPNQAPSTVLPGQPAVAAATGPAVPDAAVGEASAGTASGDLGPSLSSAAGLAVAGESRPSPVLAGAAAGLLLLVAFSGLGMRRRRRPRPG